MNSELNEATQRLAAALDMLNLALRDIASAGGMTRCDAQEKRFGDRDNNFTAPQIKVRVFQAVG